MTKCSYELKNNMHHIKISGHAEYDNGGKDIVCAGISAIFYALLGALLNFLPEKTKYKDRSGDAEIWAADTGKSREFFRMAIIGLYQIEKQYPKNLKIILNSQRLLENELL